MPYTEAKKPHQPTTVGSKPASSISNPPGRAPSATDDGRSTMKSSKQPSLAAPPATNNSSNPTARPSNNSSNLEKLVAAENNTGLDKWARLCKSGRGPVVPGGSSRQSSAQGR